MTRAILNMEAELVETGIDDYSRPDYHIVITINGHEIYRFPTNQVYSLEEGKIGLAEVVADHLTEILERP